MTGADEPILVTLRLVEELRRLGIDYLVGGSVASSVHGRPRTTDDVDVVARLAGAHVDSLVAALAAEFYIDGDMIRDAIARRSSFNIIHLNTMLKVDVFVFDGSDLAAAEMARRVAVPLRGVTVWFASPEDIVVQKLAWYERGHRISERQWRDVLGVLSVQGARFDVGYARRWAAQLGLSELLEQALTEAGE
jgi:hypothetical protein